MKKAFLDQMLLGWLALAGVVIFIATIADERNAKNKYNKLEDLSHDTIDTLSSYYFNYMQGDLTNPDVETEDAICEAQSITDGILNATTLGKELKDNDKIKYIWRDLGSTYDSATDSYSGGLDGYPDTVTAVISNYTVDNFWYKLLGKDTFNLPGFSRSVNINDFTINVDVNFRGVINAGYFNMVGTYEVGDDGCPENASLILANKKDWEDDIGETMANIEIPKTKIFFIADGYRRFGNWNGSTNTAVSEDTPVSFDCTGDYPTAVLDTGVGSQRSDDSEPGYSYTSGLTSRANVYFEDEALNFDKDPDTGEEALHMDEVAEEAWGAFVAFMEKESHWNAEAKAYADSLPSWERDSLANYAGDYDGWRSYVEAKNIEADFSPTNQYVFISEDLSSTTNRNNNTTDDDHDKWNSDRDFSDMSFSMLKMYKPKPIETSNISDGSIINVTCD